MLVTVLRRRQRRVWLSSNWNGAETALSRGTGENTSPWNCKMVGLSEIEHAM
ncbi:hypothetical protein DPMN_025387 [Dreissena polymorpha]|uniref:Uncharacterized protein n=1 Tax=Dreissena polymorpha TaxID=45954 RepID=A0A9D4LQP3_DREPO|nr:hypothetical protein DPMN_025387 [Dreissena polymorpha]